MRFLDRQYPYGAMNEILHPDGRVELRDTSRIERSLLYNHDLAPVPPDSASVLPNERPSDLLTDALASSNASPPSGPRMPDLRGLSITRRADGGLRIEAPPALAEPLAAWLESLVDSLRADSGPATD